MKFALLASDYGGVFLHAVWWTWFLHRVFAAALLKDLENVSHDARGHVEIILLLWNFIAIQLCLSLCMIHSTAESVCDHWRWPTVFVWSSLLNCWGADAIGSFSSKQFSAFWLFLWALVNGTFVRQDSAELLAFVNWVSPRIGKGIGATRSTDEKVGERILGPALHKTYSFWFIDDFRRVGLLHGGINFWGILIDFFPAKHKMPLGRFSLKGFFNRRLVEFGFFHW